MTQPDDSSTDPPEPLWQFVPRREYQRPSVPARNAVADAWASLKRMVVTPAAGADEAPHKLETDLRALDEVRLAHFMPPLRWDEAARALAAAPDVARDMDKRSGKPIFVVGQPFCGHAEMLDHWARQHAAVVVEAPPPEAVLRQDMRWLDNWPQPGRPWVVPALERWFLRHAHGLHLVRELLHRIDSGQLGAGMVGCDSWSLAYLQRIWPLARVDALTLQSFDAARLRALFTSLVTPVAGAAVRFRDAARGNDILTVPPVDDSVDVEFVQLAAHCRGNVGTAASYWRERLRSEPEAIQDLEDIEAVTSAAGDEGQDRGLEDRQVWVAGRFAEPLFPSPGDDETALLLHVLLLHGGLPEELLPDVLPIPVHRLRVLLLRLRNASVLRQRDGRWYVCELAYTAVRGFLRARKLLTDDF